MTEHEDADGRSAAEADDAVVEPVEVGDADLVLRTRSGDRGAFGELWRRHYRSGITVARNVSPGTDADDLVQEAYTKIYQSILRGGGPTGSFRAYLFTSIRNTAAGWGRVRRETTIDELETLEDPATTEQATTAALDRGLTHQAFRSLPTRWQEVLWYSEIEGMKPAEMAPLLGMKPTAVAQLAFRAREGLREAWIQAHLRTLEDGSECAWSVERLGAYSRNNIGRRDRARLETHLVTCARCAIVASEAKEVSSRLTLVLVPLTVGIAGAGGYLASLQGGGAPIGALAAMPSAVTQAAVSATAAGSATATGSAAAAVGAGSAGAATFAGSAGAAAVSATATVATATAVATTGAVGAGVISLAAVSLVVAGAVASAVALPSEDSHDVRETVATSQTVADTPLLPLESLAEAAVDLPAAGGPSPSDVPEAPTQADAGASPDTPVDVGEGTSAEAPQSDGTATAPGKVKSGNDSPTATPNPNSGPGNSSGNSDHAGGAGEAGENGNNGNGNGNGNGNNGTGNNGNGNGNSSGNNGNGNSSGHSGNGKSIGSNGGGSDNSNRASGIPGEEPEVGEAPVILNDAAPTPVFGNSSTSGAAADKAP